MLNLERAQKEVATILMDVDQVLSEDVQSDPVSHLPELAYAEELLQKAETVFPKANIVGYAQPGIEARRETLDKLDMPLAKHAVVLLDQVVTTTEDLQKQIDDMSGPASTGQLEYNAKKLYSYWHKEYNREIDSCCMDTLVRISSLIHRSPYVDDDALTDLIHTLKTRLSSSFKDETELARLKSEVSAERVKQFRPIESLLAHQE